VRRRAPGKRVPGARFLLQFRHNSGPEAHIYFVKIESILEVKGRVLSTRCAVSSFRFALFTTVLLICFASFANAQLTIAPTTTLAAETGSNTSAFIAAPGQPNGNTAGRNVSKLPVRSLLYPGSTTKIYAAWQPWFGPQNHIQVGYSSADPAQVKRQVEDMISRGIQGAIVDWYGTEDTFIDAATQQMRQQAEAHPGFEFALMEDGGSLLTTAQRNGCDVTQQAIVDLTYGYNQYMNSPAYTKIGGRPVIFFFGVDTWYVDWDRLRAAVPGNPIFLFRGPGGFTETPQSNGAFQWLDLGNNNPFDPQTAQQAAFYSVATSRSQQPSFGSVYKGFNDTIAIWSTNRVVNQHCGQTWLDTFNEVNRFYNSGRQLPAIQLVTWNDYEEGTEIESGVENCMTVSPAMVGGWLTWNVTGNENTVDHYTVWISTDGQNLMRLKDVPAFTHAFEIGNLGLAQGTYVLYVEAVGKASVVNHMSPAIGFRPNNQTPNLQMNVDTGGGMTVTVNTNGSKDPDGVVTGSQIDFGDGTVVPGPTATHAYTSVGAYDVRATVWDNLGAFASSVRRITAKPSAQGITVLSPSNGATQNFPNPFVITANSTAPVTGIAVYIGGQLAYLTDQDFINTPLKVFKGNKTITVQAWDATGKMQSTQFAVNAEPQDIPAQAVVDVYPLPKVSPLAVLSCTARSSDPDGFILQTVTQFSDGFTGFTFANVHVLPHAGTFGVSAAVIDQFGAGSTAQTTVTVPAKRPQ
jgi:PKD domain